MNSQPIVFAPEAKTITLGQRTGAIMKKIILWVQRYRSRQLLARLDDRMLSDIGLSRADAYAESDKPFWKA